jgi:hypothetical protein
MQLPYLIRLIESHAEELTNEVMEDLRDSTEMPHLKQISEDELRQRAVDLYSNLGKWLTRRGDYDLRHYYRQMGTLRCEEGIPASEVVYAVIAIKRHLWDFVLRNAPCDTAAELYQEEELLQLVSQFFDVALYSVVDGHESSRAAGQWALTVRH